MRSLKANKELVDLSRPQLMGIINVTPDSFYTHVQGLEDVLRLADAHLSQGADWLDIGGCSTRPGSQVVSENEEWARLAPALNAIRARYPNALLSVDTFYSVNAERSITDFGVQMINDISGGDQAMYRVVAERDVAYVLTYNEAVVGHVLNGAISFFAQKLNLMRDMGIKDVLIDPGFGFQKTSEQNFSLLNSLDALSVFDCPILVGLSRKSMIYKNLSLPPDRALNGTTALHVIALQKGANFLRAHDVSEAREVVTLMNLLNENH